MSKTRVFIVDDYHTTTSVMKLYLEESGYKVAGIATNDNFALGDKKFKEEIEQMLKRRA